MSGRVRRRPGAVALVLCLACAGCRVWDGSGDATVTLRFWGLGREGEVVAELIREFERENPGVRVRTQQIPWTAAHEKLLTAHVGGATPDVAQLGNTWIAEFAVVGALEPLDRHVEASAELARVDFFEGAWDTNVAGDSVWGIPWYVDTRLLFYRTDLLAAAGFDSVPGTWDGWIHAMRAVKEEMGPDRYPLFLPTNEWAQPVIFGLQKGSTLLRDGGRYGAFRERPFREAFDFYLDLYRSGLAPPMGDHDVANPYQEFARGFFAMWITGPWNVGELRRRLPADVQDRWSTAPLPGPAGPESAVSLAGGANLVVFRTSRHKVAAFKLVEFLTRPEQQLRFHRLTGSLPARIDAWRAPELSEDPHIRAFWEQLQRMEPLPAVPEIESIMDRVIRHAESSIRGGAPPDRSLAALDRDVDRILEKRRWMLDREAAEAGAPAPGGGP